MKYLKILAIALALFLFLRLVSSFVPVLISNKKIRMAFRRIFPVIEMLMWISYIFWASHQMFYHLPVYNLLTGSMIIVITAIFGWYLLRDFISGIILKAENGFEPGQRIISSEASGTIKKSGYRCIEVITSEGEYVKIPYSRLSPLNITRPADAGRWVEHVVKFKISSRYESEKIRKVLENRILEMPWIVPGENFKFTITRDETENYIVVIHIHSLSPEMAIKTEETLQVFVREVFM
ncbi:MAG: hypothetical protein A2X05_15230 [Bacteroidetes bacterium GWE2_41_25]|nr:MAG: hypothetical protein A2X03_14875 [Bacteroidetes bacterium GWA2_40_15]OFX94508.1 MAG: hypothetical protein A2X06_15310 [Bacteroidetes bacterium GWC2_40_22]OFY11116.1 MAG: hypothetical protein A2X05_15230 [Bacteroidetes bacterium GWE2_41_25]OFY58801.1 MAG: hypothetical protein A2X04_14390 [Bacteroidetes bacterium GWF2_41_9]HBH83971.1 hypothetical protein [Bacteroidales bacterium]